MRRDAIYGAALVAGALAALVTMALHPTGRQLVADVGRVAPLVVAAHAIALVGVPVSFFGALGLTRRLARDTELPVGALVAYGFALVAVIVAAVASGLIAPHLAARMAGAAGAERDVVRALWHYNGQVNQAFAIVHVAASSAAIVLWSAAILVTRALPRGAGLLGCAVGAVTLLALLAGHLRLDVHGFGLVVLGQSAWMILVGWLLVRGAAKSERRTVIS